MRREISTSVEIKADARRVWEILADFSRYAEWNPFMPWMKGEPSVGASLFFLFRLWLLPLPACASVLVAEPGRELRWAGGLRGLLRAEHYMCLETLDGSHTRLRHGEIFTGLLVPLAWRLVLARRGLPAYENTNAALKLRVEKA